METRVSRGAQNVCAVTKVGTVLRIHLNVEGLRESRPYLKYFVTIGYCYSNNRKDFCQETLLGIHLNIGGLLESEYESIIKYLNKKVYCVYIITDMCDTSTN